MEASQEFLELKKLANEEKGKEETVRAVTRFPSRHFNTQDFLGKYHFSKIENKLTPIPGTQLRIEKNYEQDIELYHQNIINVRKEKQKKLELKLFLKQQSVSLQTRVYFDTVLGEPINEAEKILQEREKISQFTKHPTYKDHPQEIKKFLKNVEMGRYHYIGFAVSHGFESVDYQDPTTGNTAMHTACRLGYPLVVEELLKYHASADMKNSLGNYPIHEAWMFWSTATYRTKEERLDQEKRTCEILLSILSYGGFVDAQDLTLQTPLHIAARLGPVRAVKIILTFRCEHTLRTKLGQMAVDIAKEFQQIESYQLLSSWDAICNSFTHFDFHMVWHKFLLDFEAVMNNHKPASTILSELELATSARHMGRESRSEDVLIDDPLLQSAFILARAEKDLLPPKPWDKRWKRYVKSVPLKSSTSDLEHRLESLKNKKQEMVVKVNKSKFKEQTLADIRRNILPPTPLPLTWTDRYGRESELEKIKEENLEEDAEIDIKNQMKKTDSDESENDDFQVDLVDSFFGITKEKEKKKIEYEKSDMRRRRKNYAQRIALDAKFLNYTKQLTHESALALPLRTAKAPLEGTEEEALPMRYILSQGVEFEKLDKYKQKNRLNDILGIKEKPKKSTIGAYTEEVAFNKMIERDMLFDKLYNIQGLINNSITVSGNTLVKATKEEKIPKAVITKAEKSFELGSSTDQQLSKLTSSSIEVEKKVKIDLVNDVRPRYVNAVLLPDKHVVSKIDELIQEQKFKDEKALMKKLKLNNARDLEQARAHIESTLIDEQRRSESPINEKKEIDPNEQNLKLSELLGNDDETPFKIAAKAEHDREIALQRLFLNKPTVKYGEGRLLSSHNLTGKLEEPWSVVDGRYQTITGDRTI